MRLPGSAKAQRRRTYRKRKKAVKTAVKTTEVVDHSGL
jgi:hypothetical protein